MTIGERIKEARKKAGLTQKELGDLLGITQAAIGQFEKSTSNPQASTLEKIAFVLNINPLSLVSSWEYQKQWESEHVRDASRLYREELPVADSDSRRVVAFSGPPSSVARLSIMAENLDKLNETGQDKALEQIEMLTKIPEYQKDNSPE